VIRVLYVNHTSTMSGGEVSLLTTLRALGPEDVAPTVACPPGALAQAAQEEGLPWRPLRGTAGSLRLDPRQTPRALAELFADGVRVRALAHRRGAHLVHANSIRAGLVCAVARVLGGPPVLVSVRDVLPPGRVAALTHRVLERTAAVRLANSQYTLAHSAGATAAEVLYPPVDVAALAAQRVPREPARTALGLPPEASVLATVGQITPWKGHDDAIRVLARLRDGGRDAWLLVVGSAKFAAATTRYDNHRHLADLEALARDLGVAGHVCFLGERKDVARVLSAVDLLLLPSWNELFGRVALEAMALEVPVVATDQGGPVELLAQDAGVVLPPREPARWAEAVEALLADPGRRAALARRARVAAESRFGLARHVAKLLAVYDGVLANSASSRVTLAATS